MCLRNWFRPRRVVAEIAVVDVDNVVYSFKGASVLRASLCSVLGLTYHTISQKYLYWNIVPC